MLSFWLITRRLDFICRRFGTFCLFHLNRHVDVTHIYVPMKMEQTECSETSAYKLQTPGNYPKESTHIYLPMKMKQCVPKRRHINSRRRGITQKKACNIQNTAKAWNQEDLIMSPSNQFTTFWGNVMIRHDVISNNNGILSYTAAKTWKLANVMTLFHWKITSVFFLCAPSLTPLQVL